MGSQGSQGSPAPGFGSHYVPLVVIGGFGGQEQSLDPKDSKVPVNAIPLHEAGLETMPVAITIKDRLVALSKQSGEWLPSAVNQAPLLHINQVDQVHIAKKSSRPSILSPRNPESELYPDKLFTFEWVRKYLYFMPTTVIMWYKLPTSEDGDDFLGQQMVELKEKLDEHGIYLLAVVAATGIDQTELSQRAAKLRRNTGLAPRTGLITVSDDYSVVEVETFVESTWQLLVSQSADFFASKSREVRHKRNILDDPTSDIVWETRYTFKLAAFAELKADYHGALRLYESTYDCILQLFDTSVNIESPTWASARQLLDTVAAKIFRIALYLSQFSAAFRKFNHHLRSTAKILNDNKIPYKESASYKSWAANAYFTLAELVEASKASFGAPWWGVCPPERLSDPPMANLPRSGFLYLESAKLYGQITKDSKFEDPYWKETFDKAETAFENALTDLVKFPSAKAKALLAFGDWHRSQNNQEPAIHSYKQGLSLLSSRRSLLRSVLSERLLDVANTDVDKAMSSLMLFSLDKKPLESIDADAGALEVDIFECSGMFYTKETYVGRNLRSQVALTPTFKGELTLSSLKIQFSTGSKIIKHDGSKPLTSLSVIDDDDTANLTFKDGKIKVFETMVRLSEPGEVEFVDVQIFGSKPKFSQRLHVQATNGWHQAAEDKLHLRHLWVEKLRHAEVGTRPPLLAVSDLTVPKIVAPNENLKFDFKITSSEEEQSKVSVKVTVKYFDNASVEQNNDIHSEDVVIEAGGSQDITVPNLKAPEREFRILISLDYTTETDQLPAKQVSIKDVEVSRPFRVSFDLRPEFHPESWPNVFVPTELCDTTPLIRRRWMLGAAVLGLSDESIVIHSRELNMESEQASLVIMSQRADINESIKHNETKKVTIYFETTRKDKDVRNFEAEATLKLEWSRASTPEIRNVFNVPPVRLNLPNQEPRVLAVAQQADGRKLKVDYFIENATTHILTFAVSMASSNDYITQGPKAITVRMLPYSRRSIEYMMAPLGESETAALPEFRVFDTHYKRALAVLPGNDLLQLDRGALRRNAAVRSSV